MSIASISARPLFTRLLVLRLGVGVGHDPRARAQEDLAVLHEQRADRDRGVHVARIVEVADAAAVGAAPQRLELVDDLHRAHLRRARERAGRERRAQQVEPVEPRAQPRLHVRDDVHHVRVALDHRVLAHAHAADLRDAAHVVAAQVDQHHVLGALLRVGEQLASSARSSSGVRPRGRVPAIGRTSIRPSSSRTRISGDEPISTGPSQRRKNR